MPAGSRTGPQGLGPRSGRGAGYCSGYGVPGYVNPAFGRMGLGRGGGGRGWRHMYHATGLPGWARFDYPPAWGGVPYAPPMTAEQEKEMLKDQAEWLKEQAEAVNKRLEELEGK